MGTTAEVPKMDCSPSPIKNLDLSEEKMDIVEEKFKESMSGDNRGPNKVLAGSESNKDSKENCNPINEVERVVKLEKKSSKKGFFAPFKPPQKLVMLKNPFLVTCDELIGLSSGSSKLPEPPSSSQSD